MPSIDLLVFSSNGARGALQRGLTRATWLDAWVGGGGRGAGSGRRIALFALCGAEAERLTPLREGRGGGAVGSEEAPRLGLLHLTCTDGYRHLLLKTLHALRWLLRRRPPSLGPPARLIFKTDEDTYLCVGSLGATLSTLPQLYSLYLGTFSDHTKLRLRRTERWRDTQHFALFNFSSYPPYAQGALYGLSSDLAAAALHIGESPPLSLLSLPLDKVPVNEDATIGAAHAPRELSAPPPSAPDPGPDTTPHRHARPPVGARQLQLPLAAARVGTDARAAADPATGAPRGVCARPGRLCIAAGARVLVGRRVRRRPPAVGAAARQQRDRRARRELCSLPHGCELEAGRGAQAAAPRGALLRASELRRVRLLGRSGPARCV